MEQQSVFTQKNIYGAVIRFAIPGVITILMAELYNMVDTFFVGRYVGAAAIGALSIAFPVQRMIIALSLMIGVGTATAISRAMGQQNPKALMHYVGNSITLGLLVLFLVPLLVYLFPTEILSGLGARGEIFVMAKDYIFIVTAGTFFLGFTNIFGYEMTAMGHPKVTLIATTIGTLINIAVDFILVVHIGLGVRGAAIATIGSQFVALLYTVWQMNRYREVYRFTWKPMWDVKKSTHILAIGFATFIVEISDAVLIASLNNILLPIGGNDAVIIVGAITRVSMFMYITIIGISAGMQPLAAYSYGAGEEDRLRKIVIATCRLVIGSSLILWSGIMIWTPAVIGSFMKEAHLLREKVSIFRLTISIFPVISLYYVCIYYCQSVGKAKLGFFLSIYRQLLLFIPLVIVLTAWFGAKGAWMTYPLTDLISAVTGIYFLFKNLRREAF